MSPRLRSKSFCSHLPQTARKFGSSLYCASLMGTLLPHHNVSLDTSLLGGPSGFPWSHWLPPMPLWKQEVWIHSGSLLKPNQTGFLGHSHSWDLQRGSEALLSKQFLTVMKHANQVAEGACLRPHIAAKRQPVTEARGDTEGAQNLNLESLALTSALNTQWTSVVSCTENLQADGYHLWSILQSFLWPGLFVPLSLSKGVMKHPQLEHRLCWHPAAQMLHWTLPIPPLCKTVLGRSGADFSWDFWHSSFQPWPATPRKCLSFMFWHFQRWQDRGGRKERRLPETP